MKILIVGLGGIGQRHVRNLKTVLGDEAKFLSYRVRGLTHLITPQMTTEESGNIESEYNISVYHDLDTALNESPDCIFICNPTSMHTAVALKAAGKGCHLFIEKPISDTWEGMDRLIKITREKNLVSMVGFQLRFHPGLQLIQTLLQNIEIGPLIAANICVGEFMPGWHKYEDYRGIYAAKKELGGGVILTQIHEIDYCYSLFGMPKRVFTIGGKLSSLDIDVEDTASTLLEYWRDGRPFPIHLYQDYLQLPPDRKCEIIGEYGKIAWNLVDNEIIITKRDGYTQRHTFDRFERNTMFVDEISHFINCIRRKERPILDIVEGSKSLTIALAARKSMENRTIVEIAS